MESGVDMITLSDDWGSNGTMLFSPRMWRRMIRPPTPSAPSNTPTAATVLSCSTATATSVQILPDIVEMWLRHGPPHAGEPRDPQVIKDEWGDKFVIYGLLDVVDGASTCTTAKR
ncbi:MAG: hypothetical protein R3A10_18160 [Caldilineaceae bacterium]